MYFNAFNAFLNMAFQTRGLFLSPVNIKNGRLTVQSIGRKAKKIQFIVNSICNYILTDKLCYIKKSIVYLLIQKSINFSSS